MEFLFACRYLNLLFFCSRSGRVDLRRSESSDAGRGQDLTVSDPSSARQTLDYLSLSDRLATYSFTSFGLFVCLLSYSTESMKPRGLPYIPASL